MSELIDLAAAKKAKGRGRHSGRRVKRRDDDPVTSAIERLNSEWAFVLLGGEAMVLREVQDFRDRPAVEFDSIGAFRMLYESERFLDGETDRISGLGALWLKHPERRTYHGVVLAPDGAPDRYYNMWRGFAVQPAPFCSDVRDHVRHFRTFYDHVLRNVCHGNADHARWLWGWAADMYQHPTVKNQVAVVLRGKKGSGKSKVSEVFGSLLGVHAVMVDNPVHLTGQFTGHLSNALLLQVEEGFWAGDPVAEGRLKSLITSNIQMLERKGIDATPIVNLIRPLITSNAAWVVPATFDERRFAVFDVGDDNRKDFDFFKQIDAELDGGGREHLLAYLLRFDLSSVNTREAPNTQALFEQKIATMSELEAWWMERLREGRLLPQHTDWKHEVGTDALFRCFRAYAELLRSKSRLPSKEQFGIALRKLMPDGFTPNQKVWVAVLGPDGETQHNVDGSVSRKRVNGYKIPDLRECRAHFEQMAHWTIDWGDESPPEKPAPTAGPPSEVPDHELRPPSDPFALDDS